MDPNEIMSAYLYRESLQESLEQEIFALDRTAGDAIEERMETLPFDEELLAKLNEHGCQGIEDADEDGLLQLLEAYGLYGLGSL